MNPRTIRRQATALADADRWKWAQSAACRGEDLNLFFGPDGERQREREVREEKARKVCLSCTVRTSCADYALERPEKYGMWGGLNEDQRYSERRRRFRNGLLQHKAPAQSTARSRPSQTDVTGTRRRLQALAVVGHGSVTIAARIGGIAAPSHLNNLRIRERGTCRVDVAEALARVFPRLIREAPAVNSFGVAQLAAERGWDGPDAWSGVDMDDPDARPRETANAA